MLEINEPHYFFSFLSLPFVMSMVGWQPFPLKTETPSFLHVSWMLQEEGGSVCTQLNLPKAARGSTQSEGASTHLECTGLLLPSTFPSHYNLD